MEDNKQTEFYKKFAETQASQPPIVFDTSVNYGATKFKFASLKAVQQLVQDHWNPAGFAVHQRVVETEQGCSLCTYVSYANGFTTMDSKIPLFFCPTSKWQDRGAAITYAKRYALCMAFGIVAEEDNDCAYEKQDKRAKQKSHYKVGVEAELPWDKEDELRFSISELLPKIPAERQQNFWISLGVKEVEDIPVNKLESLKKKLESIVAEKATL